MLSDLQEGQEEGAFVPIGMRALPRDSSILMFWQMEREWLARRHGKPSVFLLSIF